MASDFFDKVYRTTAQDAVETLYNDWAGTYDTDVTGNGYMTPGRVAAALAAHLPTPNTPILDFACGTGLSGAALAAEGFSVIDGCDLSGPMLETARTRGIYRHLFKLAPDEAPDTAPGDYAAIAAIGALSPGAAPAYYLDTLLDRLVPGGLLALSYNDHTLAEPAYTSRLARAIETGKVAERFQEHGDHLVKLGSKSTVYILEKQAD
ncbi:class I SAM-dependent DNA methyltransferase [Rhodovibrio salinarum]|uniref:Methyltransferase domain-containing protein n=1 Tax=Rhodovibrio salinarum TaxID=1087 RepID=A0A934UXV0_9PROT|nr:methyltransferase domain-containing protein [Rhodovibrio salinarum]MBK1695802.1 hypothetical protein [Rhodovibrio salinarum]